MSNVIDFPEAAQGQKIALYTSNHIYIGTILKKEPLLDTAGLWLENVSITPIRGQVLHNEILYLNSVCVCWNQVVAFCFPPTLAGSKQNEDID